MNKSSDWPRVAQYLDELYEASEGLEQIFPGRKFTLDGHLVGSVGEVVAAYIFDLDLNTASTMGHDAKSQCGKNVEIKLTQGRSVAIRHEPEHLIFCIAPKADLCGWCSMGLGPSPGAMPAKFNRTDSGRSRLLV